MASRTSVLYERFVGLSIPMIIGFSPNGLSGTGVGVGVGVVTRVVVGGCEEVGAGVVGGVDVDMDSCPPHPASKISTTKMTANLIVYCFCRNYNTLPWIY